MIEIRDSSPTPFGVRSCTYSESFLTKPEDKLIALSGLAKKMQALVQDEYVAGVWRQHLPSQLLWNASHCRQSDGTPSVRPEKYRAPSFSWASVDRKISGVEFTDEGTVVAVLDVRIMPLTDDTTRLLTRGYLLLRRTLKPLKLSRNPVLRGVWVMTVNGVDLPESEDLPAWKRLGPQVYLDVDEPEFEDSRELFCICVQTPPKETDFLRGLILERREKEKGEFKRLGVFLTDAPGLIAKLGEKGENESVLPCEQYDAAAGSHTIRIIV